MKIMASIGSRFNIVANDRRGGIGYGGVALLASAIRVKHLWIIQINSVLEVCTASDLILLPISLLPHHCSSSPTQTRHGPRIIIINTRIGSYMLPRYLLRAGCLGLSDRLVLLSSSGTPLNLRAINSALAAILPPLRRVKQAHLVAQSILRVVRMYGSRWHHRQLLLVSRHHVIVY